MIDKLKKLADFLEKERFSKEAGSIYKVVERFSDTTPPIDDVKLAASYPGNMGMMEMFQFQRDASPAQKRIMNRLLDEDRTNEAWEFLKQSTGTDLHDPKGYEKDTERRVIETIGDVKIYRDSEWGEYIVVPKDGDVDEDGYFTDDLEDAVSTAKAMTGENNA